MVLDKELQRIQDVYRDEIMAKAKLSEMDYQYALQSNQLVEDSLK